MKRLVMALAALLPALAEADIPRGTSYQGVILDASGQPLNGSVDLGLRLWRSALSTAPADRLYAEAHANVPVVDGVYSIVLGGGGSPSGAFDAGLFAGADVWLEVSVNGQPLTPRQRLYSVAYAFRCVDAERLGGVDAAQLQAENAQLRARLEAAECRLDLIDWKELCEQPADVGPCSAMIPRWTYDVQQGDCVQFTYGGCGGNSNNFATRTACESACGTRPVCP